MRFALRNQEKIKNTLGETELVRINRSLEYFFTHNSDVLSIEDSVPYPLLSINDIVYSSCMIVFYVVGKKYDVYRLAFKEFINNEH